MSEEKRVAAGDMDELIHQVKTQVAQLDQLLPEIARLTEKVEDLLRSQN